jgi:hypothetical protein
MWRARSSAAARRRMNILVDYPRVLLVVSFIALWLSSWIGVHALGKRPHLAEDTRDDFGMILTATLTLLGLIIGFSFSMAISRYDQRKNYEEAEANAIGTEYVRADLLPPPEADKVRVLLAEYLQQRELFYSSRDEDEVVRINSHTSQLQNDLWAAVVPASRAEPTPVMALVVSGMNDVLNSQGYTQAAWLNRMPGGAWLLMMVMALGATLLVGYNFADVKLQRKLLIVLPCVLAVTFMLIADIDSPRRGLVRVVPQNLHSLAASIHPH